MIGFLETLFVWHEIMKILVCGGAGYIGSHACMVLIEQGHEVVVYDNLVNSSPKVLERMGGLAGFRIPFVKGDIRDRALLSEILSADVDAVIHFAALKSVGESCLRPLDYFDNNIHGTITLLQAMMDTGVRNLVFSSSATVYGDPQTVPITEGASLQTTNPYGRSKLTAEQLIGDLCSAVPEFSAVLLRYFNPAGAHPSGLLGEDPAGVPNNLVPYIAQVAMGLREYLNIYGDDYPTRDGTGVRDYIHVMDLAEAHAKALKLFSTSGATVMNLGTGIGYSVKEMIAAFEQASGRDISYRIASRRAGDVAEAWANPVLAHRLMGWSARRDLASMCVDVWNWHMKNPDGYETHIQ